MRAFYLFITGCCCLLNQSFSQSKTFHLGLKTEFYAYTSQEVRDYKTYSKKFSLSPVPSLYLLISKEFSESVSLSLKPGVLMIPDSFIGVELGLVSNYRIYNDKLWILSGVNMHLVTKSEEGRSLMTTSKNIYFILIGAGYQLTDWIAADISFHQALNKEYGYIINGDARGSSKIFNMLKIGLSLYYF
jgi:hypothetical protein